MSRSPYVGGARRRNARETYVDQISNGRGLTTYADKKRKTFTHLRSLDDSDLAYRSTSKFLRESRQDPFDMEPMEMMLAKTLPRTKSVSEMTPRPTRPSSGNPMYKAQEDYYDEVQALKKELKAMREENSTLRSKNRRLEEDVVRKKKELDSLGDPTKDNDLRRALSGGTTDRNNLNQTQVTNVVMSLKQRIFKLQSQLKEKENRIDEMESDPRWTRSTELEIQNRALAGEVERQKVERRNLIQNDYSAALDEEKKSAVKKLDTERKELAKENESLKRKIDELENAKEKSAQKPNDDNENDEMIRLREKIAKVQHDSETYCEQVRDLKKNLHETERQRDDYREKFEKIREELEELKRENARLSRAAPAERSSPVPRPMSPAKRTDSSIESPNASFRLVNRRTMPTHKENIPERSNDSDRTKKDDESEGRRSPKISQRDSRDQQQRENARSPLAKNDLDQDDFKISTVTPLEKRPSDPNASRPTSANTSQDSALRTIQASLRGFFNRSHLEKTSTTEKPLSSRTSAFSPNDRPPKIESEDDDADISQNLRLDKLKPDLRSLTDLAGTRRSEAKVPVPDLKPDFKKSLTRAITNASNPSDRSLISTKNSSDHNRSFSPGRIDSKRASSSGMKSPSTKRTPDQSHDDDDDVM